MRRTRQVSTLILIVTLTYVAATAFRMYWRRYYIFAADYVRWTLTPAPDPPAPTHVFLLFTDHFEPSGDVGLVRKWSKRYAAVASRHRDSTGRPLQHTWFYPGEQRNPEIFLLLYNLVANGFGEVELHLHHARDTEATLRAKLATAIESFQARGFLKTPDGRTRFAFIHGNWALDNSEGGRYCGVNVELQLLRELGCFADFTFPSIYRTAQPPWINTIYAAKDDQRPKSYARRLPVPALFDGSADLMIFEGPLVFSPSWSLRHLFLDVEDGNIHPSVPATPARADDWVRANIHLPLRPDWIFIKIWGHNASTPDDVEAALGSDFERTLSYLERQYNDGTRYRLHYITAREAYNLAIAAARDARGDPDQYLETPIPPYVADGDSPRRWTDDPR